MTSKENKEVVEETLTDEAPAKKSKKGRKKDKSLTEEYKLKIAELERDLNEAKDKYLRLFAEFDNYKKRTTKERLELISTAGRDTISAILPVLDDFDRAKQSAEDKTSNEVFSEGVQLVYNKLYNVLKARGVESMESTGNEFDPEFHEALTEIPAPSDEMKGKIIDTIEKGYLLNDKIIRYAKVVVGK